MRIINLVKKPIQTLEDSAVYAMSLGSRELYHSNVWWWLINNDHTFVKVFVGDLVSCESVIRVTREEGNRDITIWVKAGNDGAEEKAIVIENKLKSIPTTQQLEGYTNDLGDAFECGVLTGFGDPSPVFVGKDWAIQLEGLPNKPWRFVSYKVIASSIRVCLRESKSKIIQQNKETIEQYIKDIDSLYEIVTGIEKDDPETVCHIWDKEIDDLGIQDLINKRMGSRFISYFLNRAAKEKQPFLNNHYFRCGQGFNRKKTGMDFRFSSWLDNHDKYVLVGVTIDGDEYRRTVECNSKQKGCQELFDEYKNDFFDSTFYGKKSNKNRMVIWPGDDKKYETSMLDAFDSYKSYYNHVYQYCKIGQNTESNDCISKGFSDLYEKIVHDLTYCQKIFEDHMVKENFALVDKAI